MPPRKILPKGTPEVYTAQQFRPILPRRVPEMQPQLEMQPEPEPQRVLPTPMLQSEQTRDFAHHQGIEQAQQGNEDQSMNEATPAARQQEDNASLYFQASLQQLYPCRIANPRCAKFKKVFQRPHFYTPSPGYSIHFTPVPAPEATQPEDATASPAVDHDTAPPIIEVPRSAVKGAFASRNDVLKGNPGLFDEVLVYGHPLDLTGYDLEQNEEGTANLIPLNLDPDAFTIKDLLTRPDPKGKGQATQQEEGREEVAFEDEIDPKDWIADIIIKMMYVSGETGEPSAETTGIIEDIVRQQVIEILRSCTELAARRGARAITINDLIFQIRDDAPKVSRLRTFLSWKDVRKNVKDSDDKGGEGDLGAGEDPVGGVVPGGPVDDTAKKNKKAKVGLPWEPSSYFAVEVPEREDEEDEEEEEMNHITLQRLRKADERTKAMTREEYVTWSEFRQASFTYRKGKRFREWAGFGIVTDSKPSDDIVDILGFLTFEMVQTLTEEALKIKENEDQHRERTGGGETAAGNAAKKRKMGGLGGLFDPPSEGRTPVEPRHIQEAFRRLQGRSKKSRAMLNGTRIQPRTNLKLF
ncbi:transcription initiation factor IID, 18kD subunit-domain-containing protein [Cercophora samala]|uniref:Transcription initiation factor IID, 18kD subunit-domain-containing protein n=1 Tax=Cercophora samala TaxID=330535 RepID=A0AA40DDM4_9PEZI|nr:transcription initiation factor IID, 18kD subunit-domain-containing protein [Cercophora samala]